VLTELNAVGVVVVARWYGGILLGPARFTHIENCAREAIEKWTMSADAGKEVDRPAAQKRKVVEDEARRSELVRVLEERDHSISALRGLLRERTEEAAPVKTDGKENAAVAPTTVTPIKAPNYSVMPLQALERLEKARDATISWILKEIEKVEQEQQQQQQQIKSAKDFG
jgi:Uncharacterized protein family UPF0029